MQNNHRASPCIATPPRHQRAARTSEAICGVMPSDIPHIADADAGYTIPDLPDRNPAADGAVQHLRGALDPFRRRVQRVGNRGLRRTRAVDGGVADAAEIFELLLKRPDAGAGIEQLVADGE